MDGIMNRKSTICSRIALSRVWISSRTLLVRLLLLPFYPFLSIGIGERLKSGVVVMCKSGKDRTGMLITLREATHLQIAKYVDSKAADRYLDLLRGYGTRIMNTEKNTGKAQYMFNSLQNTFLPKTFQAPRCTRGHGVT